MRDPNVPESLESWWILHRMFGFDRRAWAEASEDFRADCAREARALFERLHESDDGDAGLAQLVGHKGDLLITNYAKSYDGLALAQTLVDRLALGEFLVPMDSYVSVLEIGLYEATARIHADLEQRGLKLHSAEWNAAFDEAIDAQARSQYVAPRLWAKIPQRRYVCFYPMNKKRDGSDNWYSLPYGERAKLMVEHGKVGRMYHGRVTQVISGSIGFDDYEWGVDLYADDPLVFKKLVYEMRFDEASARYAEFGPFWSGLQFSAGELPTFLTGESIPSLQA